MNKMILRAQAALANKTAEMYVDKTVWVLAIIIVGMALMWGVYKIFNEDVLTSLKTSITKLFTNADSAIGTVPQNSGTPYSGTT